MGNCLFNRSLGLTCEELNAFLIGFVFAYCDLFANRFWFRQHATVLSSQNRGIF